MVIQLVSLVLASIGLFLLSWSVCHAIWLSRRISLDLRRKMISLPYLWTGLVESAYKLQQ